MTAFSVGHAHNQRAVARFKTRSRATAEDGAGWGWKRVVTLVAQIEPGKAQLISRNGHPFASFSDLAESIARSLLSDVVLDVEIVCMDPKGRPQFNDLLFRRDKPCFLTFDLLYADGKDFRRDALVERKAELKRLTHGLPADSRARYADHVDHAGSRRSEFFHQATRKASTAATADQQFWRVSNIEQFPT